MAGQMIDFNRALQETRQMIEPPSMERIQYNNWLKRQANLAPVDEDWVNEQKNTMFMDGYRPNASLVPGVSTMPADPQGFDRSIGVSLDNSAEIARYNAAKQMEGYRPNSSYAPGMVTEQGLEGYDPSVQGEAAEETEHTDTEGTEQGGNGNAMFASIQEELQKYDDGTYQYAMSVLQKLPTVFAKYENADPSRAMPYFLAGQPGRQRETEMVRFNEFMR
jgi:hypothetical protein